jgi:hypothetical protein
LGVSVVAWGLEPKIDRNSPCTNYSIRAVNKPCLSWKWL